MLSSVAFHSTFFPFKNDFSLSSNQSNITPQEKIRETQELQMDEKAHFFSTEQSLKRRTRILAKAIFLQLTENSSSAKNAKL